MSSQSIKVGMVGLDTSHAVEFTRIFQQLEATQPDAVIKVVAGFPGGSDLPISQQRVPEFTTQMKELGVEIVHDIDSLLDRVDALMLESVDGEVHLEQAQQVMSAGKPIFIDKPLANSVDAAFEILRLSTNTLCPVFPHPVSASAATYSTQSTTVRLVKSSALKHGDHVIFQQACQTFFSTDFTESKLCTPSWVADAKRLFELIQPRQM